MRYVIYLTTLQQICAQLHFCKRPIQHMSGSASVLRTVYLIAFQHQSQWWKLAYKAEGKMHIFTGYFILVEAWLVLSKPERKAFRVCGNPMSEQTLVCLFSTFQ